MVNVATQDAMTALIRNGGFGGGGMADTYFTRNSSLNWAKQFDTESGALPLVPVGARGSRRRIDEANQNIGVNPTAGTNTDSWDAPGTNTVERVTDFDAEGLPQLPDDLAGPVTTCFKFTFGDDNTFGQITAQVLTAEAHAWSSYILIPTANTATVMTLDDNGSYVGAGSETFGTTNVRDAWDRVRSFNTPVGGDLTGTISWRATTGSPTAGDVIYVAMTQVEANTYVTSATAGHLGTGYAWDGAAHASTSQRTVSQLGAATEVLETVINPGAVAVWWTPAHDHDVSIGGGFPTLISQRQGDLNQFELNYAVGVTRFGLTRNEGGSLNAAIFTATYNAGEEQFIVANLGATTMQLFVNGVAGTAVANIGALIADREVDIGGRAGARQANGTINAVEFFNRELTLAEIVEMDAKGPPPMGAILP